MAFQFLCPNGHLLQGEESFAGQQCQCPYCSTMFIVPAPLPPAPASNPISGNPAGWTGGPVEATGQPTWPPAEAPASAPEFPVVGIGPGFGGRPAETTPAVTEMPGAQEPLVVHVLCPNKHELETQREMLGQDAMCPYCQAVFRLRLEDTVEYRKKQEEERERREYRRGILWMRWSIAVAVVVILGVILLVVLAASV